MSKKATLSNPKSINTASIFENISLLIILFSYLAIDFLPKNDSFDIAGIQWLYLSLLNIGVATYLFFQNKKQPDNSISSLMLSPFLILYSAFVFISGISILVADNKMEGLATFSSMMTIFSAFLVLSILAQKKKDIFHHFAMLISIILFFQVFFSVSGYYLNAATMDIFGLQQFLKGNTENINIFATSIQLKIPFLLYCIYSFKKFKQLFFIITFFLSCIVIFLTSSRSNILALAIVLVAFALFIFISKNKSKRLNIVYLIAIFGLAFFIQEKSIVSRKQKMVSTEITSFEISNKNSGNRFLLWNNAFTLAKEKPLTGYGLGSYKIKAIPLESKQNGSWKISKYSHNDFLQIAAETGFINALLYLFIFIFGGWFSLKKLLKSDDPTEKWTAFVVLLSLIILGIDSVFNFPMHRPIILIHFLFILFWLLHLWFSKEKNETVKWKISSTFILTLVILVSVITLIPNYLTYKSFAFQSELHKDENTLLLSSNEVENSLPNFPNLTIFGQPVKAVKANYLIQEGKYDKALHYLNESIKQNENMMYNESVLAVMYAKLKQNDSIYKYTKKCHEMHPLVAIFYENYMNSLVQRKDTTAIIQTTNSIKTLNYQPRLLMASANALLQLNYPTDNIKKLLQEQMNQFPNDTDLLALQTKLEDNGMYQLNQKINAIPEEDWAKRLPIYLEMLEIEPNNSIHAQNIGMAYFKVNEPKKALPYLEKALTSNTLTDGKTEFVLGLCYFNLKEQSRGCEWLAKAKSKNYPVPAAIYDSRCL